jgi:hypothetical protein
MKSQRLNRRQARWALELSEYSFTLTHKPGSQMICADALSRRPDYDKGILDNENITLLPHHLLTTDKCPSSLTLNVLEETTSSSSFLPSIQEHQHEVEHLVEEKVPGWKNENGLITWYGRIWVPIT